MLDHQYIERLWSMASLPLASLPARIVSSAATIEAYPDKFLDYV